MNIGILTKTKELGKKLEEILSSKKHKVFLEKPMAGVDKNCQWIYENHCGMVFIDFIEEDLAGIKIMQSLQNKVESRISFVFLFANPKDVEYTSDNILTCLNEGGLGFILEHTPKSKLEHYVTKLITRRAQAIKREDKGRELVQSRKKTLTLERVHHRLHEINRKKNQFILERLDEINFQLIKILFLSGSKYRYERFKDFFMETGLSFSINFATSLETAVEDCVEEPPDIIVSDYILPDGSALDLNKLVREKTGLSTVRLLVLTSDEKYLLEVEKPENKIDSAMLRPSNRDEYLELLTRVLIASKLPTVAESV